MFWLKLALALALLLALLWTFGRHDRLRTDPVAFDPPGNLQAWLAEREAGIRPEVASHLQWARQPDQITDLAILYVHGFSASPAELRPLPEDLARRLGANLLAIRLSGHGQDGDALAAARADNWWRDLSEGLAIAHRIGRRVVVIGMSTGATLVAQAAREPGVGKELAGVVLISPNLALKRGGWLLDLPFARTILRFAGDPERCFVTRNDLHRALWTSCYPTSATLPVGALLRAARKGTYRTAVPPALFIWSDDDRVLDHRASSRVAAEWGGKATVMKMAPGPNDDPDAHVLAGEALSPALTAQMLTAIEAWILR